MVLYFKEDAFWTYILCTTIGFFNPDGADILLQSRRAKEIKATAGIGIVENAQAFCFWILLEKVPSNSESNYEISIRRIWGCVEIVACHCRIEMLSFKKDSCLADSSIYEEINEGKIPNLLVGLNKKLGSYWVKIVGVMWGKIVDGEPCLQL